jgi:hypothetical protein
MNIPIKNAMVLWCQETKGVKVVRHPGRAGEDKDLSCSDGACWSHWKSASKAEQLTMLYRIAMKLALHDDISTEYIFREFSKIPEFLSHWEQDYIEESIKSINK